MAKVRKKYNKFTQLARFADHQLKNILVCYTDNLNGCVLFDKKERYIVKPNSVLIASVGFPHQWSCYVGAFGRTALGEEYMKSEQIFTNSKYYQEDLAPLFEEHHMKLMQSIPDHQRCGVGWIASPKGIELTEKEAGEIFNKLGAWDE